MKTSSGLTLFAFGLLLWSDRPAQFVVLFLRRPG